MKKFFIALATVMSFISADLIYPATMVVEAIDGDTARISTAHHFTYEIPAEDWCEGDVASLLMFSNGTENIEDDIVLDAHYSSFNISM